MAMNVLQSPSRPGLGKVSGFFWRNPGLGLFLLLLGPLMWFGIVYFGSLLTLLWQGFYTFDDFTMSVTPELTLANIRALFNPANYDIIVRTLTMAAGSHYRQRHSGFSNGVVYGALYQRENESVFLYRGNVADVGELHC